MLYLTLFFTVCYSLFIGLIVTGINKLRKNEISSHYRTVSVIISARNEEQNIAECISTVKKSTYPPDKWELIVVDDRSEDATYKIAESFMENMPNLRLLKIETVPGNVSPKKNALETAIRTARGEIILTTDADTRPQEEWISGMAGSFDTETALVIGLSPLIPGKKNLLSSFQFIGSITLGGLAAGSAKLGFPLTCTARNMAYKKNIFDKIGGFGEFKSYISGDDDLLMHRIKRKTNGRIKFASSKNSVVDASPAESIKDFISSRTRHSSKFRVYPLYVKFISGFLYIFNILIISVLINFAIYRSHIWLIAAIAGTKFLADYTITHTTRRKFGISAKTAYFPIVFLLHPIYVAVLGLLGLRGKFNWKNKNHNRK